MELKNNESEDENLIRSMLYEKGLLANKDSKFLGFSIVSDEGEYMGAVSLFNIKNESAELYIYVIPQAMGKGYAWYGLKKIIQIGFEQLGLSNLYWSVERDNKRAINFFDKHNFHEVLDIPDDILNHRIENKNLKWYSVLYGDKLEVRDSLVGCRIIHINTIPTISAGELSFFECNQDIPFEIKRIYYITKVPEGVKRGFHAHKELKQVLFCPYGKIQITLENKNGRASFELDDPSIGIVIEECTWREMLWLQKDSVLCVGASDYYKVEDYIRDYEEFRNNIV